MQPGTIMRIPANEDFKIYDCHAFSNIEFFLSRHILLWFLTGLHMLGCSCIENAWMSFVFYGRAVVSLSFTDDHHSDLSEKPIICKLWPHLSLNPGTQRGVGSTSHVPTGQKCSRRIWIQIAAQIDLSGSSRCLLDFWCIVLNWKQQSRGWPDKMVAEKMVWTKWYGTKW